MVLQVPPSADIVICYECSDIHTVGFAFVSWETILASDVLKKEFINAKAVYCGNAPNDFTQASSVRSQSCISESCVKYGFYPNAQWPFRGDPLELGFGKDKSVNPRTRRVEEGTLVEWNHSVPIQFPAPAWFVFERYRQSATQSTLQPGGVCVIHAKQLEKMMDAMTAAQRPTTQAMADGATSWPVPLASQAGTSEVETSPIVRMHDFMKMLERFKMQAPPTPQQNQSPATPSTAPIRGATAVAPSSGASTPTLLPHSPAALASGGLGVRGMAGRLSNFFPPKAVPLLPAAAVPGSLAVGQAVAQDQAQGGGAGAAPTSLPAQGAARQAVATQVQAQGGGAATAPASQEQQPQVGGAGAAPTSLPAQGAAGQAVATQDQAQVGGAGAAPTSLPAQGAAGQAVATQDLKKATDITAEVLTSWRIV